MPQLIHNPDIPYLAPFEQDYGPGKMIRIQGTTPPNCERFNINLQCGPNVEPRDDIALHLSVRPSEGYIARNSLDKHQWGQEQGQGYMPIGPGQNFEIIILCEQPGFKVAVNGKHFCEFTHRMPPHRVSHLAIDGDVALALINHEDLPSPLAQQAPSGPPMQGPPMQGPPMQGGYGPPQGPPQGNYGPGPYGPPAPPGHEESKPSGLESFLGETGMAVAGMLGQQAIQRLSGQANANQPSAVPQNPTGGGYGGQSVGGLGSIGSILTNVLSEAASGANKGAAQPQQGGYPHPQGGQEQAGGLGAIGSILSNVLADSTKPNNPPPPQQGYGQPQGGQDQGGLGAIGSILSNVLSDQSQNRQQPPPPQTPQGGYGRQDQGSGDLGNLLGSFASSFLNPQQPRK